MSDTQDFYFVHFDPTMGDILNWMAIQQLNYEKLPLREHMLPVTKEQFDTMHNKGRWAVKDGKIVEWTPPAPVMPTEEEQLLIVRKGMTLTAFQLRAVLQQYGYLDTVGSFIAGHSDKLITLAWEHEKNFKRLSALITAIQNILDITDEGMDDLFVTGASIDG
jgi:hypothetical protein